METLEFLELEKELVHSFNSEDLNFYNSLSAEDREEVVLAHYGKKGMRWGVRKDDSGSSSSRPSGKPSTSDIKLARSNLKNQQAYIKAAESDARSTTGRNTVERAMKMEEVRNMKTSFMNNPDRVTAAYLTKGEKIALGFVAVGNPGVALGYVGGNALGRRTIAKKQARGDYNG